ncbi:hypothetical protein [uncultured Erythrobacter sp.]|uniref:hypothetical protein n=1 Tax=uncultured Erythrobacter sp. TaxID=263913 RepID=UPI0026325909|nr:hypothetical protein [uncultured Erythrobacter sp.]
MASLYAFAASLTLFLPFLASEDGEREVPAPVAQCTSPDLTSTPHVEAPRKGEPPKAQIPSQLGVTNALDAFYRSSTANQVRIEQRVTIRITPYRQSNRNSLLAQLPRRGVSQTFEERPMNSCVPVAGIAGVQTGTGNRLLLFLRDQRIISLNLERGCEARDFYSGFYVERNEDGRLCVKRDLLQSRSGAKCEVERMRRLVQVDD